MGNLLFEWQNLANFRMEISFTEAWNTLKIRKIVQNSQDPDFMSLVQLFEICKRTFYLLSPYLCMPDRHFLEVMSLLPASQLKWEAFCIQSATLAFLSPHIDVWHHFISFRVIHQMTTINIWLQTAFRNETQSSTIRVFDVFFPK